MLNIWGCKEGRIHPTRLGWMENAAKERAGAGNTPETVRASKDDNAKNWMCGFKLGKQMGRATEVAADGTHPKITCVISGEPWRH